jgi:pimeloyl-ACP methyl ester carboxylesterase
MKIALFAFILCISSQLFGQITGVWHTSFTVAGTNNRMDLYIDGIGRDGTLKIGLPDIAEFEPKLMEDASITKETLEFSWPTLALKYKGKYSSKGDSIYGIMSQSGLEWNVTFKREEQELKKSLRPQEPKPPFDYTVEELIISKGKFNIGATLTTPKNVKNFPIVVLASGSGPQNRDCEIMGHKPFWVIADYLTKNGIAVLRFDDRGTGKSTADYSKANLEDFSSDVEACYKFLRKKYKKNKIGLAGHSEGGMHTLIATTKLKKVDFLIQLAAVGTNGREVLVEQQYLIPIKNGQAEELAKWNSATYDTLTKLLIASPKADFANQVIAFVERNFESIPSELKEKATKQEFINGYISFLDNTWARGFMQFESSTYLQKITCPILVINGSEDIQVPPLKNQEAFRNNFSEKSKAKSKVVLFPGLNHLFQTCKKCSILEYGDLEETVSPKVLNEMVSWIKGL